MCPFLFLKVYKNMNSIDNIFVTSDHHFFQKINDFRCHSYLFNMSKEELDEWRIQMWNSVVQHDSIVYYVGDITDGNVK